MIIFFAAIVVCAVLSLLNMAGLAFRYLLFIVTLYFLFNVLH